MSCRPKIDLCECGEPKPTPHAAQCTRCRFLDGVGQLADVIACLREYDAEGATAGQLARDLGRSRKSVHGSLAVLEQRGRVVRSNGRPARYALHA